MMLSPATFAGDVGAKPICTGPYKFVERVQNDRIVLDKPQQTEANIKGEDPFARRVEVTVK